MVISSRLVSRQHYEFSSSDIDTDEFNNELEQFLLLAQQNNLKASYEMHAFIHTKNIVSTFPNVDIILRIYLTLILDHYPVFGRIVNMWPDSRIPDNNRISVASLV